MKSGIFLVSLLFGGSIGRQLGVEFVGVGYNLLKGNPDGSVSDQGGVDPGLLYTRKILNISPGDHPPEVVVERRHSCARVQETHVFYGTKSYQNKLALGVKVSGGMTGAIINFAFSLSGRYQHAREETTKNRQVFLDDQHVCNLGRVRYADELTASMGFSVSQNFAAAACRLPVKYDEKQYMDFIDKWGTHITMQVELGTKNIKRYKSSLSEFVEHVRKQGDADVSVGGSFMGSGGSLTVNFEKYKSSDSYKQHFGEYQYRLEAGTLEIPDPIDVTVVSIDTAFNPKYWQKKYLNQHQCQDGNSTLSLSSLQTNVVKAVINYPAYKMAHPADDPPLKIPITWPQGTYGLMKPKTGCPRGRGNWFEGWRSEDFENMMTNHHISYQLYLHMAGFFHPFANTLQFQFCIKGDRKSTDFDMMWPAGDYCVLKYGDCPDNFQEGWVYWNDEHDFNKNRAGGTLPDGVYNDNTKIFYCCRDDAVPTHLVVMPADKPFYLLRYRRGCQRVLGMHVTNEYIQVDTENIWGYNSVGGAHPYIDGDSNPRMHYCYYTPMTWYFGTG